MRPETLQEPSSYHRYSAQLQRPLKLEDAERAFDAMLADTALTHEERESLAWSFFQRAYRDIDDAKRAFDGWLTKYRESTEAILAEDHEFALRWLEDHWFEDEDEEDVETQS